jgi:3-deoxy-manno-octulosonate cytidylyltransferase (CMP-KDO synthetase)
MVVVGMIPARYASSRFNGKVLAQIAGKPMVQHVYERACKAKTLERVLVATDDERVVTAARDFGAEVAMTSPEHASGTDRLAEVARTMACDAVVNIQGDEPLIEPAIIDRAVEPLLHDANVRMATLATRVSGSEEHEDNSVVKVVCDAQGNALYFSRLPIPYFRLDDPGRREIAMAQRVHPDSGFKPLKHIGLYVYRRETLLWFAELPRATLEVTEGLEQLRALENGCRIRVVVVDYSPIGVDTPEDLRKVQALMEGAS